MDSAGWWTFIPVVAAVLGALVGGYVVHRAAMKRDVLAEQRAGRVEHLISAFRRLVDAANRSDGLTEARRSGLESAITDVMLLGQPEEIDAAKQCMLQMGSDGHAALDPVIVALRTNLRRELRLPGTALP